jgi:hypothetical protein
VERLITGDWVAKQPASDMQENKQKNSLKEIFIENILDALDLKLLFRQT